MASPTVAAPRRLREGRAARREAGIVRAPHPARRAVPTALWITLALFAVFVAAGAIQIRLISGQRHLDHLEQRIVDAQVRQYSLRQQEAMLRSPAQISQTATNDLGMVAAAPPAMLTPPPQVLGTPEPQQPSNVAATDQGER